MLEPEVSQPFDLTGIPVEDDSAVRIHNLSRVITEQSRALAQHLDATA